jgi:hypothetical protein
MSGICINLVQIAGHRKDINKVVSLLTEKFDFNRVIPMPEELVNTKFPIFILTQAEYENQQRRIKEMQEQDGIGKIYFTRGITKNMQLDLIFKYGHDNRYDWALDNWGVSWSTRPDCVNFWSMENRVSWDFQTPDKPPKGIYNKLTDLFPEVKISWWYGGVDMPTSGWL